jgi:hypothetical protein
VLFLLHYDGHRVEATLHFSAYRVQKRDERSCATSSRSGVSPTPLLPTMNTDFFLASVAPNIAGVRYPLRPCFLNPGTHFVLVLIEPVAAKDLAPCESLRCRLYEPLQDLWIICSCGMPPWCFQCVAWVMNPVWAGDSIAFTQKLDSGGTKGTPAVRKLSVLRRLPKRFTHEFNSPIFGMPVPGIAKVAQSNPWFLTFAHLPVRFGYGLQRPIGGWTHAPLLLLWIFPTLIAEKAPQEYARYLQH